MLLAQGEVRREREAESPSPGRKKPAQVRRVPLYFGMAGSQGII